MNDNIKWVYAIIKWNDDGNTQDVMFGIGANDSEDDDEVFYWLDSKDQAHAGYDNGEWTIVQLTGWSI